MDWTNPDWPLWQDFVAVIFTLSERIHFSKYVLMLSAAEADQGIALGWHSLVHPLIQQRKLVRTTLGMRDPIGFLYRVPRE